MKKLKNTKKLLVATSALVIAVAVSAGTTFAWFTSNDTVSVSSIEATVKSDSGDNLMIGVGLGTDLSFKTEISTDDLKDAGYLNVKLDAVTYRDSLSGMATATVADNALTYASAKSGTTDTEGVYVKIPLTIRTTKSRSVYLSSGSAVTGSTVVSTAVTAGDWMKTYEAGYYTTGTEDYKAGDELTAYVKNAARVGITTLDSASASTESTLRVWSPNEARFDGGDGASGTVNRSDVLTESNNYYKNNLAGKYFEYINGLSTGSITQASYGSNYLVKEGETTDASYYTIATTAQVDGSNDTNYYAFIYVYVWIEGTDGDCFNNILGQTLSSTIAFTVGSTT